MWIIMKSHVLVEEQSIQAVSRRIVTIVRSYLHYTIHYKIPLRGGERNKYQEKERCMHTYEIIR